MSPEEARMKIFVDFKICLAEVGKHPITIYYIYSYTSLNGSDLIGSPYQHSMQVVEPRAEAEDVRSLIYSVTSHFASRYAFAY